jgi:hypothetical protein
MKPLGFAEPRSPAAMILGATEKVREKGRLVVKRSTGRGSACMVGWVGNVDQ